MSYTRPANTAANFKFAGVPYTRPANSAANFTWSGAPTPAGTVVKVFNGVSWVTAAVKRRGASSWGGTTVKVRVTGSWQ